MDEKIPLIVKNDPPLCTLMINNPAKRNALTPECCSKIMETFDALSRDEGVRVAVLRGVGGVAFSAGADIGAMPGREADGPEGIHEAVTRAAEAIQKYSYPVIAMLNGYTLGAGCILAMSCDIRVAARHVKMGIPTSKMGLISDVRTFRRFHTVLGYSTALELFLTGRFYDSQESLQMGLVNHVVESENLESFTYDLAREISECAPLSLRGSKSILTKIAADPNPSPEDLETFHTLRIRTFQSEDHEEAKQAFKEKRKPRFKGR
ncbi:MAG: enoyl-CoA hydratase-related protein [Pseudomonadota bacterium]